MKLVFIFFIILFLTNCSLNKDSKYWTEDVVKKSEDQKKLSEVLKKSDDPIPTLKRSHLSCALLLSY